MKISLNCKLDDIGAYDFIKPIANIREVEEVQVFRNVTQRKFTFYQIRLMLTVFSRRFKNEF